MQRSEFGKSRQKAFESQANMLDLRMEDPTTTSREIGLVFVAFRRLAEIPPEEPPVATGPDDDAAITQLIEDWESLTPEDHVSRFGTYATNPHIGVGRGYVGEFDTTSARQWLDGDELARERALFPHCSPRQVQISDLNIVYVGMTTAVATYRVEETALDNQVRATNAGLILLKGVKYWKIGAGTIRP